VQIALEMCVERPVASSAAVLNANWKLGTIYCLTLATTHDYLYQNNE
jgi:hypothetical protein